MSKKLFHLFSGVQMAKDVLKKIVCTQDARGSWVADVSSEKGFDPGKGSTHYEAVYGLLLRNMPKFGLSEIVYKANTR